MHNKLTQSKATYNRGIDITTLSSPKQPLEWLEGGLLKEPTNWTLLPHYWGWLLSRASARAMAEHHMGLSMVEWVSQWQQENRNRQTNRQKGRKERVKARQRLCHLEGLAVLQKLFSVISAASSCSKWVTRAGPYSRGGRRVYFLVDMPKNLRKYFQDTAFQHPTAGWFLWLCYQVPNATLLPRQYLIKLSQPDPAAQRPGNPCAITSPIIRNMHTGTLFACETTSVKQAYGQGERAEWPAYHP